MKYAKNKNVTKITFDKGVNTFIKPKAAAPNKRPDVAVFFKDKTIGMIEIVSSSQTRDGLFGALDKVTLKPEYTKAGYILEILDVIKPTRKDIKYGS